MILYGILILLFIELLNLCRYIYNTPISDNHTIQIHDSTILQEYVIFMKKNIRSDKFFEIFKSYYSDGMMTKKRIRNVLCMYMFNTHNINMIVCIERAINQLLQRFDNTYIIKNTDNVIKHDMNNNWLNLTHCMRYKNTIRIYYESYKYLRFTNQMNVWNYSYHDLNDCMRIWKQPNVLGTRVSNIIFLDRTLIKKLSDGCTDYYTIFIRNQLNQLNTYCVEIKGFTDYNSLYDTLTLNYFNKYHNILSVSKKLKDIFNYIDSHSYNIYASNIATFIIPFLVKNGYKINKIFANDPLYYPYLYHVPFIGIQRDGLDHGTIALLDNLSLYDLYFDTVIDKSKNILYNQNTHISFSPSDDNLYKSQLLELYSNCTIIV